MSKAVTDFVLLRRPPIDYVSPPVCEVNFSATGFPIIVLEPIPRHPSPTGFVIGGSGNFRLSWNAYPGAICFSVYRAVNEGDPTGPYILVAECIQDNFFDAEDPGCYRVSVITGDGESDLSPPICGVGENAPTAITDPADNILAASARLHGRSNPEHAATTVYFEWGPTTGYGNTTAPQAIGNGGTEVSVFDDINGLSPVALYHFRIVATNSQGTTMGDDQSFTTQSGGGIIPVPIEYWELEEPSGSDRVGSVQHIHIVPQVDNSVTIPGKIDLAPFMPGNGFLNPTIMGTNNGSGMRETGIRNRGIGFTLCFWLKCGAGGNENDTVANLYWGQGPPTDDDFKGNLALGVIISGGVKKAFIDGTDDNGVSFYFEAEPIVDDAWTFFRGWFDPSDGSVKIQVNNGTIHTADVGRTYGAGVSGTLAFNNLTVFDATMDEIGLWMPNITDAQGSLLWNSGNGQRPPFS